MFSIDKQKEQFRIALDRIYPLENDCWSRIESIIYLKKLAENEYFSVEGQGLRELGFLYSGILRVFYLTDKGHEWNEAFLLKNDFVASGVSPEKKSITNIQALSEVLILCIPYDLLIQISTEFPQLNIFIQKLSFRCLEQRQNREIRLQSEDAMSRYLLFRDTFPNLEDEIQHYHIASYLGISPTQLSRLRKKIK